MKLKVKVNSVANDVEYGGEQTIEAQKGEYLLDEVFRLPFFRIIIDDEICGALCFRLMEGGVAHYFVLEESAPSARFFRETSLGEDEFIFSLTD